MKRIICITGIILIACVITGAVVEENTVASAEHSTTQIEAVRESTQTYILRAENGLLTVYRKGDSTPYMTTQTHVSNLPISDKDILEKGIELQGEAELRKALEDYCS